MNFQKYDTGEEGKKIYFKNVQLCCSTCTILGYLHWKYPLCIQTWWISKQIQIFFFKNWHFKLYKAIVEDSVQLAHHNQSTRCWICARGLVRRTCGRLAESCCSRRSGIPFHDHWLQVHWCGLVLYGNQHRSGGAAHQSAAAPDATVPPPNQWENWVGLIKCNIKVPEIHNKKLSW